MEEEAEICCTCLSKDRFLYSSSQFTALLAAIHLEINTQVGGICWECKRLIERLAAFKSQVEESQRLLSSCSEIDKLKSYSALTFSKKYYYHTHFDPTTNIQITCTETGPILIKQEVTDPDDQVKEDNTETHLNREESTDINNVTQKSKLVSSENTSSFDIDKKVVKYNNTERSFNEAIGESVSELPRITLVRSITEQACDKNDRFQPITEIIELNIPIPQPILVGDGHKEKEHTDNVGETEIVAKDSVKETNRVGGKNVPANDDGKNLDRVVKESITVKVKLVTDEDNDVKIKEEPLDDDDVQIETNDLIVNNGAENCSTEYISESHKNITNEKQDEIWKRSVMLVYNRLRGHKYADRFSYPITDAIAPEYSKVVKRPMDMNTIRRNIKNGVIRTTAQFQRDLLLMLTNALMYNHSEHSVHIMAKDLLTEAQYQLDMLLAVHAQKTLSDDTPTPRIRRRRDSKCCVDVHVPAKRPRLSTTPRNTKHNKEKPIEKPKAKMTSPKNFLTPVKVENIDNIEKYTSNLENTDTKRSRRKSISVIKQNSSKANKNKTFVAPKVEKVFEKETKKPRKARASTTPTVKIEPISATKITSRRNTLKANQQIPFEVENVFKHPKEVKSRTSRKIKEELITAHKPEPKKRRKSVKKENISDALDSAYMDDNFIENENDVTSDDLCVAIANANQRDMNTTQAQNVKRTLEDRILNLALDSRHFAPRFKGKPIIVDGVIKLWCECKKTLSWLSNTVDKMPRKYGRFVVRKQSELPRKVKSALLIPGFNEVDFIMRLLKAQNSGVFVDSWIVYSAEQRGENMFLVIGIPTAAIPKLSSKGFKLSYNLGSINIRFYNASGNLVSSPPQ